MAYDAWPMVAILLTGSVFDIARYALDSIFWGVLLTLACVVLLSFLIRGFYPKASFTVGTFLTGIILFLLLSFQAVLLCGAFKAKSMTDAVESSVNGYVVSSRTFLEQELTAVEGRRLVDRLLVDYPLLDCCIEDVDFQDCTLNNVATVVADEIRVVLNGYICRRIGWGLFFMFWGTFVAIKTLGAGYAKAGSGRHVAARRRNYDF